MKHVRLALLPALIAGFLPHSAFAAAAAAIDPATSSASIVFDRGFFPAGAAPQVDISRFEKGNVVLPGTYRSDIIVNQVWRGRSDVVFKSVEGSDETVPCFDAAMLATYGVNVRKVALDVLHPAAKVIPATENFCGHIGDYLPGATANFDNGEQTLTLSIPQLYMSHTARGYVDPSQWDEGINAGVLNYTTNLYRSTGSGGDRMSAYVGINASLKLGSWHLYHLGSFSATQGLGHHYQSASTYLQHDILALKAQFMVGDVFTDGQLFDSLRVRGVRLFTDDRMVPTSERGYAPTIRGMAETNARVVVKQRGYQIYETTVAPGPFVIDDLYPTGYSGDLDVEVIEADGRVKRFPVSFAATPQLLRAGLARWDITAGKVTDKFLRNSPSVLQGTYQRGLNNYVTAYGGATFATGYHSTLFGAALNTPVGAFSLDSTYAYTRLFGPQITHGNSLRLAYSKTVDTTGTSIGVAAFRFSDNGYFTLNEAAYMRNAMTTGNEYTVPRARRRLDLTVSQPLGDRFGQIYINGSRSDYWDKSGKQVDFTIGYGNSWKSLNYSLSAQRTSDSSLSLPGINPALADQIPGASNGLYLPVGTTRRDTRVFFTLSMPLGSAERAPLITAMSNHSSLSGTDSQVAVTGAVGDQNRLNYSTSLGHNAGGTTVSAYGQYNSPRANVQGGYSHGSHYGQLSAGITGTVVAHAGGVTFSPPAGDTLGLVEAPDAVGAIVTNGQGSTVNSHGYALVPYLQPYELNSVGLDPEGTAVNVQLKETTQNVAPRAGSVVRLKYQTETGRAVLINSKLSDGRPLPFGADVVDADGKQIGVVGQASQVFVNGLLDSGVVTVRWGEAATDRCHIQVNLPPMVKGSQQREQETFDATCVQGDQSVPTTSFLETSGTTEAIKGNPLTAIRAYGVPTTRVALYQAEMPKFSISGAVTISPYRMVMKNGTTVNTDFEAYNPARTTFGLTPMPNESHQSDHPMRLLT